MPEEVIRAIMSRRNPRTGHNYTREEAEAIVKARAINAQGWKNAQVPRGIPRDKH